MQLAAKILSVVFHPLLIPTYLFLICFSTVPALKMGAIPEGYGSYFELSMIKVFVLTFFFPLITILMMIKLGFVKSLQMKDQKERLFPYIAVSIYFLWAFMVFFKGSDHLIFVLILLSISIAALFSMIVNTMSIKISMHTVGLGIAIGLVRTLMELSNFNLLNVFLLTLLIAGAVGTARLLLKAHSSQEIYVGYLVGLFSFFLSFRIEKLF